MVGGVGQRMLASVSKRTAGEFFDNVAGAISGAAAAAETAPPAAAAPGEVGQVFTAPPRVASSQQEPQAPGEESEAIVASVSAKYQIVAVADVEHVVVGAAPRLDPACVNLETVVASVAVNQRVAGLERDDVGAFTHHTGRERAAVDGQRVVAVQENEVVIAR